MNFSLNTSVKYALFSNNYLLNWTQFSGKWFCWKQLSKTLFGNRECNNDYTKKNSEKHFQQRKSSREIFSERKATIN